MHQESDPEAANRLALLWASSLGWWEACGSPVFSLKEELLSMVLPVWAGRGHGWGLANPGLAEVMLGQVREGRRERIPQLSL